MTTKRNTMNKAICTRTDDVPGKLASHAQWLKTHGRQGTVADFSRRILPCEDFVGVDLRGANFSHSNLAGADFTGAHLNDASFYEACLYGADFTDANLTDAVFENAFLRCADFTGADLRGASATVRTSALGKTVTRSVLGANFTGAHLSDQFEQLANALKAAAGEL